jgi:hypothetical protein
MAVDRSAAGAIDPNLTAPYHLSMTLNSRLLAALLLASAVAGVATQERALPPVRYTSDGSIPVPEYSKWVFIGSGAFDTADASAPPRFSNVFVEPAAYDAYVRTGKWPDRTVIFSEKRAGLATQPITKGRGWGQTGDALGFEFEVKDLAKGGWRYYTAESGQQAGKAVPNQADCTTCHAQHGAVDNTFVQFYPKLTDAARRHGTVKPATR